MTSKPRKHHHPYVVKGVVTSGIFACTVALFVAPEFTPQLGWVNLLVSLVWIWGDDIA